MNTRSLHSSLFTLHSPRFFQVVKVCPYALDFLIGLMAFAGYQDNIPFLGKVAGYFYRLSPIGHCHTLVLVLWGDSRLHLSEDFLGVFLTRVVGGEYHLFTQRGSYMCHDGSLAFVTIPTTAYHGDKPL